MTSMVTVRPIEADLEHHEISMMTARLSEADIEHHDIYGDSKAE